MLRNTFCHIPGIKLKSEQKLWSSGIRDWDDALTKAELLPRVNKTFLAGGITESKKQLELGSAEYFSRLLPMTETWRLYADFIDSTAFLDIETSGGRDDNYITAISLYDGVNLASYVQGDNLDQFVDDIFNYNLLVTYNGKCFDIPFIEQYFNIRLTQGHIDLRHVLHSLGLKGGLKGCERTLGIDRRELSGMNGYLAILLWNDYAYNGNDKALETLLAYNVLDTVNLEILMVHAYNRKLASTPFLDSHQLKLPDAPINPFLPDMDTVYRIMRQYGL